MVLRIFMLCLLLYSAVCTFTLVISLPTHYQVCIPELTCIYMFVQDAGSQFGTDKAATCKQKQGSKSEHTKDGGTSEEPKGAPDGVKHRETDAPEQVAGNPTRTCGVL